MKDKDKKIIYRYMVIGSILVVLGGLVHTGFAIALALCVILMAIESLVRKSKKFTKAEITNLYYQIESMHNLQRRLGLSKPLPPMRGYAGSPDFLNELAGLIEREQPKVIVEASSGVSSIVCGRSLQQLDQGKVFSLEHDPEYGKVSAENVKNHGLADIVDIVVSPLERHDIKGESWLWYGADLSGIDNVDLVVVDGPPVTTQNLARYPALPLLIDKLNPGALIVLDDSDRPDETEIIKRWIREFDGLSLEYSPRAEKGMTIIRKK